MDRRQALLWIGRGLCGVAAVPALAGCSPAAEPEPPATIGLEDIPDGGRLEIVHDGVPVELVRDGATVEARWLRCTHTGCRVRWHGEEDAYLCACHGGRFDAAGRPVAGPPTLPLPTLPVTVAGGTVTIGPGSETRRREQPAGR